MHLSRNVKLNRYPTNFCIRYLLPLDATAERGIAMASRLSVCQSFVRSSICL